MIAAGRASPPHRPLLLFLLDLAEVLRPEARREVLPAAVGEKGDDVTAVEALGCADRDLEHRAGRDAGEDSLFLHELLDHRERGHRTNNHAAIENRFVQYRRDEAFAEIA